MASPTPTSKTASSSARPRLLQKNVLDRRRWVTRDELRIAIVT